MDSLFSTEYFVSSTTSAALSPGTLLKLGLDYVQQGDYAEGAALLALVRTHFSILTTGQPCLCPRRFSARLYTVQTSPEVAARTEYDLH